MSPSPDTASKRAKGIYETPKKFRVEKTGEISQNLRFFVFGSCAESDATNKDAEFASANSDAPRWYTSPLVKQGIASDRDLPGCNAMLANELMYYIMFESKFLSVHPSFP